MPKTDVIEKLEIIRHTDGREWVRYKGIVRVAAAGHMSAIQIVEAVWRHFGTKLKTFDTIKNAVVIYITHPQYVAPWSLETQKVYGRGA